MLSHERTAGISENDTTDIDDQPRNFRQSGQGDFQPVRES